MEKITSSKNPIVLSSKALNTIKGRQEQCKFICEGQHLVEEAFFSKQDMEYILVEENSFEKYEELIRRIGIKTYLLSENAYSAVSDTKSPQGISMVVKNKSIIGELGNRIIALNSLQDPGNVGTIIRTADAAGFSAVISDENTAEMFSPKILRSSMGSLFHLPCLKEKNLRERIIILKEQGYKVYGGFLNAENFFNRPKDPDKIILIIGNEGQGISKDIEDICDIKLKLPMYGKAESLNAAIAAAIMMYDISRNNS